MNAGDRYRRGSPVLLDPDPLRPLILDEGDPLTWDRVYQAGYDDGYEKGIADSLPPMGIIVLAAFTGLLLGILLAVSALR